MTFKWLDRRTASPGPYLTLVLNEADYLKAMKQCKVKVINDWIKTSWADATAHMLDHPDGGQCVIVALREKEKSDPIEIAGLLVHEAVHIAQRYFASIGEHAPAEEQQAYAIQAFSQELMAEYARQVKERKK